THVRRTTGHLYAIEKGGLIVHAHLAAFLESDADCWFKIDPDTFVRRALVQTGERGGFFGTIQTRDPRPVLQGGCIGGTRDVVRRLFDSGVLELPAVLRYEETWAANSPTVLKRAKSGLACFDYLHAWAS